MLRKSFFALAFTLTMMLSVLAQSTKTIGSPKPTLDPPPGNIQLLENYTHTQAEAIDTIQGQISKPEGITIYYQNGHFASDYADSWCGKGECLWYKVQKISGNEIRIGLTKDGKFVATITKDNANFYAQTKSAEDIADFLIMVFTYKNTVN